MSGRQMIQSLVKEIRGRLAGGTAASVGVGAATQGDDAEAGIYTAALSPVLRKNLTRFLNGETLSGRDLSSVQKYLSQTEKGRDAASRRDRMRMEGDYSKDVDVLQRRIVDPESLVGRVGVPVMGDRSIAGASIMDIEGVPLSRGLQLEGGPNYGLANEGENLAWASMKNAANTKQNQITRAAEETGRDPVGIYTAMGNDAMDFNTMTAEAMILQLPALGLPKKAIQTFNSRMRKQMPGFAGIDTQKGYGQIMGTIPVVGKDGKAVTPSNVRKSVVGEMKKKEWENQGFPVYDDVIRHITEPELREAKRGDSGFSMFDGAPGEDLVEGSRHRTYNRGIPGSYAGGMEESVPIDVMFPKLYGATKGNLNKAGSPLSAPERTGSVQMGGGYEVFDQQWLDGIMSSREKGSATPEALGATAAAGAAASNPSIVDGIFDALEMPWKGYLGASRLAGGLLAGEGMDMALDEAVRQVRNPVEDTADKLGRAVVDRTGSPAAGTLTKLMILLGGPI